MYAFSFWYWGLRTQYLLDPEPNENRTNIRIRIRSSSFKNRIPISYLRKNIPELCPSVKSSGMEKIFFDIDIAFGMKEKRNKRIRIPLSLF